MIKKKKFISIIWGYHKQIFNFDKKQNYHMIVLESMIEEGFECEIFAIDSKVKIENDPNFIKGIKVIYYSNIFNYFLYLLKNKNNIIYSNSITIKTLLVSLFCKKTVFYPHSYLFGSNFIKKIIINFFYKRFNKIRVNNNDELKLINKLKSELGYICPLVISENFFNDNFENRKNGIFIGNLTKIKNPMFLIETGKILRNKKINFKIKIIGEDRYNENGKNFQQIINETELNNYIELLGILDNIQIKKILGQSLIYINTSISEGQCLGVYEGALSGCYLCLQNIISFPSVFDNNALYHNNPFDLVANIEKLINNKGLNNYNLIENQKMILKFYNYDNIKILLKNLFLNL